jgi:hypothetical protein
MLYKIGCSDVAMVRKIQKFLNITIDGIFGKQTEKAVIYYQMQHTLVADGIVGRITLNYMGILDTDLKQVAIYTSVKDLFIQPHHLAYDEYIQDSEPIINDYLVLHHTGGWENPFQTIDIWDRDSRGKIGTEFVIGGQNIKTNDNTYDGRVAQAFPAGSQAWHLGVTGSYYMNRHSVGVELCGFGQLTSDFKNYVNIKANEKQIVTLEESFNGYQHWHKYSDKQLYSLKNLITYIANRDNIDIRKGLIKSINDVGPTKAFEFNKDASEGKIKGLLTHGNVTQGNVDLFPQPELIDMLLSL